MEGDYGGAEKLKPLGEKEISGISGIEPGMIRALGGRLTMGLPAFQ